MQILAMVLFLAAAHARVPIQHPPDKPVPADVADRLYAAIEADGIEATAIEITTSEAFNVELGMILVFGTPKKSSPGVCRGPLFVYDEEWETKRWRHEQLGHFVVLASDCRARAKERIAVLQTTTDADVKGIAEAIRAARVAADDKGGKAEIPPFTRTAKILAINLKGDEALASIADGKGEETSLLLARVGQWMIVAAGRGLALP